jgi:hypothetical protein
MILNTANMVYVLYCRFANAGGVIITIKKLLSQLLNVLSALAWMRIRKFVISAGHDHVMPSQPIAKKALKPNRKTRASTPYSVLRRGAPRSSMTAVEDEPARMIMEDICPKAPKSISLRRPTRSIKGMAIRPARRYSVPFAAARRRDMSGPNPREFSETRVA